MNNFRGELTDNWAKKEALLTWLIYRLNQKHWCRYADMGFTLVWMPPSTASVSPEGYMPTDYYNLNSNYGNAADLKTTIQTLQSRGLKVIGDVVLNHRCALHQDSNGIWNVVRAINSAFVFIIK